MNQHTKYALTQWCKPVSLVIFATLSITNTFAQQPTEKPALTYNVPVISRLSKGEIHRYPLRLTAGQYTQVEATAKSGDITIELTKPDGKKLIKLRAVNGNLGKSVAAVAEETASYYLNIAARYPDKENVAYEVQMAELHDATSADRARCQGEYIFAEGEEIYDQRTKEGYLAAIEKYQASLPYFREAQDLYGEALAVEATGEAWYYLSEYQQAISAFEQTVPLLHKAEQTTKTLSLEAKTVNNLGAIYDAQYNKQKAMLNVLQAAALYRQLNNPRAEAVCLGNLGAIYTQTGQPEEALKWCDQALSILKELGDKRNEAIILNIRGAAKSFQELYQQAIKEQEASLEIWRELGDTGKQGWTLTNLAANYIEMGQPQVALELLNEGLPLIKKSGNRRDEGHTLHRLGDAWRLLGQPDKALEYYQQAQALRQVLNERIQEAYTTSKIAQTELLRGNYSEALFQSNRALEIVEQVRQGYASPVLGASYSSSTHHYYAEHIALLLQLHQKHPVAGYDIQAFQASERAHARALLSSLTDLGSTLRAAVPTELIERETALQKNIDHKVRERDKAARVLAPSTPNVKLQGLENELRQLLTESDQLQGQIRASNPRYAALLQPQPLNPTQVQQQVLTDDSVLLEYFVAQNRIYLFALTRANKNALQVVEIPDKARIEKAAAFFKRRKFESAKELQFRFSYQNPEFIETVQLLSEKLLAPVKSLLVRRKIKIVSDGALQHIPFAALPDPNKSTGEATLPKRNTGNRAVSIAPLIINHEINVLPSASTVAWLRKTTANRPPTSGVVAVIADPVFSAGDERVKGTQSPQEKSSVIAQRFRNAPDLEQALRDAGGEAELSDLIRLPASRAEAQAIARIAPSKSLIALDFEASRETVMGEVLSNYRYLHFATHAYVDDVYPGLSWLALSQVDRKGQEQSGYLRLNDIYQLRLNADLVVLGACRTGLGKQLRGEGIIGLTRGFMYAGVPQVMVSLWDVPDRETVQLMTAFYQHVLKMKLPPGESLRKAQVKMWKNGQTRTPFFWAAFTLQGDPR
jgi:CHAT domain-containing protein/tetratricopeptide (TPR) repeat protein